MRRERRTKSSGPAALGDHRPTDVAEEVYRDLTARIEARLAEFERVAAEDVAAFNKAAAGTKLGALIAG